MTAPVATSKRRQNGTRCATAAAFSSRTDEDRGVVEFAGTNRHRIQ
jgi:hypothetical protein